MLYLLATRQLALPVLAMFVLLLHRKRNVPLWDQWSLCGILAY